jgi:curved DNA-binding protein CbpA
MSKKNPFEVLNLNPNKYNEETLRKNYLELIKKYSPEKRPDKFEDIRTAYTALKNARSPYDLMALAPVRMCETTSTKEELINEFETRLGITEAKIKDKKSTLLNRLEEILNDTGN